MKSPGQVGSAWNMALRSPEIRREDGKSGTWPDPTVRLRGLADAILALEAAPRRVLKSSDVSRVTRGDLLGRPVIVKRYVPARSWKRLTTPFRPSRARRCWATSAVLMNLGIGCSPCLGFLEEGAHSLAVFDADDEAVPARRWIKAWLHQRPDDFRDRFREDLADAFLELYRHGIYHADTKASNMLLRAPDNPAVRRILWIDLECVQFQVSPSRRQVLRNLVQLNGSVGSKLNEPDRLRFLESLAVMFPWLTEPGIAEQIRRRTLVRLQRELSGQCGP